MATFRWLSVDALLLAYLVCVVSLTSCMDLDLTLTEKIELNRLYRSYNKPAVKEINTIHGDTYKCVDFYKQPAFDHPMLKNHSYHQEMQFSPLMAPLKVSQESANLFNGLWTNGDGCPTGTIPVRKYTKEQYIRTHKLFQKLYPSDGDVPGRFRATVHTRDKPARNFNGGSTALNVYELPVDNTQYTAGYMALRAGNDQFQVGWTCNPTMYVNGKTRLFLTTKVEDTKCFNLMCGGFVQTNKNIPIDTVIDPTTTRGNDSAVEIVPAIIKDPVSKLWTLSITNTQIGYWPNEVLKGLSGPAVYVEWGGEAYNPPNNGLTGPGMGSGSFPEAQPRRDGYASEMSLYDEDGKVYTPKYNETQMYSDNNDYYRVLDRGIIDADFGHVAFYGGPGKQNPP